METYTTRVNGEPTSVTLHSLDEYETAGGEYDDTGNGGEHCERSEFVAAMTLEPGIDPEDVGAKDCWLDTVTPADGSGYYLLREWPTTAPLTARCNVS